MEGLLVILVSAISLSFFLQQQQAEGKRSVFNPYFFWDDWAKQEEFIFSPPTPDGPMSIVATISPYTVYIYAKPKPHTLDASPEDRLYTEIRIPLRYTLASGFWMQHRRGLETVRLTKTAALLEFEYGNLDEIMYAEAKDPITGQWVLNQSEYRLVFDQFKDLPSKSHLEQRNLVWACESLDIVDVATELARAIQAASALDNESVKAWKFWSEELNWTMTRQHGYPMLWGRHKGVRMQISVPDNQTPYIEFNAEFPDSFPEDLGLWGAEFLKDGYDLPKIAGGHVWFQKGKHPLADSLPDNAIAMQFIDTLFLERPKSALVNRLFIVRFPGKENTVLDQHLKNWIELCGHLQNHFNPGPNPEDFMETLDGLT